MKAFKTEEKAFNDLARLDKINQHNVHLCVNLLAREMYAFRVLQSRCASVPAQPARNIEVFANLEDHEQIPAGVA